ncbi:energy transducer TonB [Salicola sp. Rm-C-2C1-2]|uniref:energy transducer TonB n=1 Tax=Salicola sp. Rm-C-2C1-2 TaxID=3141321 RepID=UPI0032E4171D
MAEVTHADRLGLTLFAALVFHGVLILGVGFAPEDPSTTDPSMDVTVATRPSAEAPEDADFLAEAAQQGSGDAESVQEMTTTEPAPLSDSETRQATPPQPKPRPESGGASSRVTTEAESRRRVPEQSREDPEAPERDTPHETLMERSRDIASLEARLSQQQNEYAQRPRINRVTSVSTMEDAGAAYVRKWQQSIERTGNLNYPKEARQRGLHGQVRMLVAINNDGSLREMKILQSSGYAVLDDAARRIVRQASPFQAFSGRMAEEQDVLEIIRTWSFQPRGLSGSAPDRG